MAIYNANFTDSFACSISPGLFLFVSDHARLYSIDYMTLHEDAISDITYFIKQNQLSAHTYLSSFSPVISLPFLRHMLFNDLIFVYGAYKKSALTSLAILFYPKLGANSTALDTAFLTIDTSFIDNLFQNLPQLSINENDSHLMTKVKMLLTNQQSNLLSPKLEQCGFTEELSLKASAKDESLHFFARYSCKERGMRI